MEDVVLEKVNDLVVAEDDDDEGVGGRSSIFVSELFVRDSASASMMEGGVVVPNSLRSASCLLLCATPRSDPSTSIKKSNQS